MVGSKIFYMTFLDFKVSLNPDSASGHSSIRPGLPACYRIYVALASPTYPSNLIRESA